MNRWLILLGVLFFTVQVAAQEEPDTSRYFVYFNDKVTEEYPYTVGSPEAYLTARAIQRRFKQGIVITESDLPVNPTYINALKDEGIDVFFRSKWLNGVLIQTHFNKLPVLENLSFVDSIRLIAKGTRLKKLNQKAVPPTVFSNPPTKTADSDLQLMMLGADLMHADGVKGEGMLIAIMDNGFKGADTYTPFQHVWQNNQVLATKDFVENSGDVFQASFGSHGTSVFSIIGANYETDSTDFVGIASEADFILCVTEDNLAENTIEEYNWLVAAEFADSLGADVINSSLGYTTFDIPEHNYGTEDLDGQTAIISMAASIAAEKGMIVVTSAGNSGRRSFPGNLVSHPSDAIGILTVASVDPDFSRSDFSSIGPTTDGRIKPDIAAFGGATAVMRGSGAINRGGGTSFASPLIAGFAACIWQINPDRTSKEIMSAIRKSGHQADKPDSYLGYGVPNYVYAKDIKALNVQDILEDKVTIYPNPFRGDTLFLLTEGRFKSGMSIRLVDPKGATIYNKSFKRSQIDKNMELSIDSTVQGVYFLFLQIGNNEKVVKLINF